MTIPLNAPDCSLREFDLRISEGYSSDLTHRDPRHRECPRGYCFGRCSICHKKRFLHRKFSPPTVPLQVLITDSIKGSRIAR